MRRHILLEILFINWYASVDACRPVNKISSKISCLITSGSYYCTIPVTITKIYKFWIKQEQIRIFYSLNIKSQWSWKSLQTINPLSANPTKWSNTLKQFVGKLPANCLSVFDDFVKLVLKGLRNLCQILLLMASKS